jgi:thiosulfate/3-mercaptopyruvate sulfurtransferase
MEQHPPTKKIFTTLITANELARHLPDPDWVIVDCRYSLIDHEKGRRDYIQLHIPGAVYAHQDEDLSGPVITGKTGRHPLPGIDTAAHNFSKLGIGPGVQVIAYDDAYGALSAVRLWWMLRWLGHEAAAVLDGGWQRWVGDGRPVKTGVETRPLREFVPHPRPDLIAASAEVDVIRLDRSYRLLDARVAERYCGDFEPIDPVAGHIPGALSAPYTDNLNPEGTFRSPAELREYYQKLLGDVPARNAICYCGSGVTSIHTILAMMYAGLGEARLYAGSWSEWITDPSRPVAKG